MGWDDVRYCFAMAILVIGDLLFLLCFLLLIIKSPKQSFIVFAPFLIIIIILILILLFLSFRAP